MPNNLSMARETPLWDAAGRKRFLNRNPPTATCIHCASRARTGSQKMKISTANWALKCLSIFDSDLVTKGWKRMMLMMLIGWFRNPPSVRFEWKWLIEIFICETHVTPAAQHGMISSANCPPYEGENIFQGFGRTFLCRLPTFGQLGLRWLDASVLCQMKSFFFTTDEF